MKKIIAITIALVSLSPNLKSMEDKRKLTHPIFLANPVTIFLNSSKEEQKAGFAYYSGFLALRDTANLLETDPITFSNLHCFVTPKYGKEKEKRELNEKPDKGFMLGVEKAFLKTLYQSVSTTYYETPEIIIDANLAEESFIKEHNNHTSIDIESHIPQQFTPYSLATLLKIYKKNTFRIVNCTTEEQEKNLMKQAKNTCKHLILSVVQRMNEDPQIIAKRQELETLVLKKCFKQPMKLKKNKNK